MLLAAGAAAALGQAEARDLAPVAQRLRAILAIQDPAALADALRQFRADLPALAQRVLADPSAAAPIADTISAALLNGWAEAAAARPATPGAIAP